MAILVTGGSGFIGLAVCEHILAERKNVVILDQGAPPAAFLRAIEKLPGRLTIRTGSVLDPGALREAFSGGRKRAMREGTNVFRVLVKTLFKAGIITDRTIHVYAAWLDTQALEAEGDQMVGDAIAADGIKYLREINRSRRVIGQKLTAA